MVREAAAGHPAAADHFHARGSNLGQSTLSDRQFLFISCLYFGAISVLLFCLLHWLGMSLLYLLDGRGYLGSILLALTDLPTDFNRDKLKTLPQICGFAVSW